MKSDNTFTDIFEKVDIEYNCEECGKHGKASIPAMFAGKCKMMCDECCDAINKKKQEEDRLKFYAYKFEKAGFREDFADWVPELSKSPKLPNWIYNNRNSWLYVQGSTGAGKTRAMHYIARGLMEHEKTSFKFRKIGDMVADYMECVKNDYSAVSRLAKEYANVDVLIVDDIGKGRFTDGFGEFFFRVIDARCPNKRTWFTSEMSLAQVQQWIGGNMGPAIIRRMSENLRVWS